METEKPEEGLRWDDHYLLGNEKVDSQHRQLFDLVNSLVRSCDEYTDTTKLKQTLDFLVNYAVMHFDDEEAVMVETGFPEYEAHKKMHDDFKVIVIELVGRFTETGSSSGLRSDTNRIIVKWLINHILSEDKKIGEHINQKN
jgi:hemerythrin